MSHELIPLEMRHTFQPFSLHVHAAFDMQKHHNAGQSLSDLASPYSVPALL